MKIKKSGDDAKLLQNLILITHDEINSDSYQACELTAIQDFRKI